MKGWASAPKAPSLDPPLLPTRPFLFVCVIYILYYVVGYEISAGHKLICNQFSYSFYACVYSESVNCYELFSSLFLNTIR